MPNPIHGAPDPDLERLLREEDEIEFRHQVPELVKKASRGAISNQLANVKQQFEAADYRQMLRDVSKLQKALELRLELDRLVRENY